MSSEYKQYRVEFEREECACTIGGYSLADAIWNAIYWEDVAGELLDIEKIEEWQ